MNAQYIGIDTSCYTTSAACAENGSIVSDRRTMLRVASGERGLRQSDGVFQHVKNLGEIMPALMADADRAKIKGRCRKHAPAAGAGFIHACVPCGQNGGDNACKCA